MIKALVYSSLITVILAGCSAGEGIYGDYVRRAYQGDSHLVMQQNSTFQFRYVPDDPYPAVVICGMKAIGTPPPFPSAGVYYLRNDSVFLQYKRPAYEECNIVDTSWIIRLDDGLLDLRHDRYERCRMIPDSIKVDVFYYHAGNIYSDKKPGKCKNGYVYTDVNGYPYIEANERHRQAANVEEAFFKRYYLDQ